MNKYFHKFLYVLAEKKKNFIFMVFAFIMVSIIEAFGIGVIAPFLYLASNPEIITKYSLARRIYDQLHFSSLYQFISLMGLLIIIIFCIKSYLSWKAQTQIFKFTSAFQGELTQKIFRAYLRAPYTFHLSRDSADLIKIINIDCTAFANTLILPLLIFVSNTAVLLSISVMLCITSPYAVVIVVLIFIPLLLFLNKTKASAKYWREVRHESMRNIQKTIFFGLGGVKETKIIGCESYFENKLAPSIEELENSTAAFHSFSLSPRIIIELSLVISLIGFVSIFLLIANDIKPLYPLLAVFGLAAIRLIPVTSTLGGSLTTLRGATLSLDAIYFDLKQLEIFNSNDQKPRNNEIEFDLLSQSLNRDNSFSDAIYIDRVTYRYETASENAVKLISMTIKKGESIALIGKSGAGKSTLVDIILGLLIPQEGDITVDGQSIYTNLYNWQQMIAYIPQSIFLIDDTIEKNIAYGVPESLIDRDRLDKAIQSAQLSEVITNLPNGLNTLVGERGVRLSGGQRQRIGIARALYLEREILVLDEATAALDNETESFITEAIQSLSGKITVIIIAHRLTTIEHCNRVYMMEKGHIVQSGSYQDVVLH